MDHEGTENLCHRADGILVGRRGRQKIWGREKKKLERKEQIYQLLACLEEKRRDNGNQM